MTLPKKKVAPADFNSYDDLVRVLSEIDSIVFRERTNLRQGAKAISSLLQIIEHMLLRVFFTNYQNWLKMVKESEIAGENPPAIPMDLVLTGEKVHKLVTNRGKFILEILKGKLEAEEEKEEPTIDYLKLPQELDFADEDGEE